MESSGRGLPLWVLSAAGATIALGHQVVRAHQLYLAPEGSALSGITGALLGVTTAVAVSLWRVPRERERVMSDVLLGPLLLTSGAVAVLLSVAPFVAFDRGRAAVLVACASVGVGAFVTALSAIEIWRAVARATLSLGFQERAPRPLSLLAVVCFVAAILVLEAHLGYLRSGLLIGAWLAVAGAGYPAVRAAMRGEVAPPARIIAAASCALVVLAGGVGLNANRRLPLSELARYPDEIVFASEGTAHRYVVAAAPGGYELFSDGQLLVATLDAPRYAAALTAPLRARWGSKRVLLVGGGAGVVERSILTDRQVAELTVLSEDAELPRLAEAIPFLAALGDTGTRRAQVRRVVAEPLVWLSEHGDVFDVVVAELKAPIGYDAGKYYTRHFFRLVAGHLASRGLAVIPATSAFSAGEAFSSVVTTVESAGLRVQTYHASIPTLGLASFVVGSREEMADGEAARFTLGGVRDEGKDLEASRAQRGRTATLHDERIVDEFAPARNAWGE